MPFNKSSWNFYEPDEEWTPPTPRSPLLPTPIDGWYVCNCGERFPVGQEGAEHWVNFHEREHGRTTQP